jgi:hypothetical protein
MGLEIKLGFSNEVARGVCVVGKEINQGELETIAVSDSTSTDLFIDGIVRKELENGNDIVILFGSEEEMEENQEHIANAFGDLLDDE